jgi:hypothetical protein
MGAEPLLVTDAQLSLQPNGSLQVVFQEKTGDSAPSCHLDLQAHLVHGLIHLLHQTIIKAEWGLASPVQLGNSTPELFSETNPAPYKH